MEGKIERLDLIGDLPSNWKITRFGDVLDGGTRNGIYKAKEFHGSGAKVVNMGELFANPRLRDVPMKRVQLTKAELEKSSLNAGDLLFARRSLVAEGAGKCIVVSEIKEPTTFESSIIRARPYSKTVDSLFLYYLFNSPYGAYVLLTIRRQVAVSGITGADLVELPIPLPPLAEQKAIASILGALDDKIELNRRMNATLEAMARALFQSWFVDFDPVRAKLDGRKPEGMDKATAALFPDAFEESSLGPVPKGWNAARVGEVSSRIAMGPFGSRITRDNFVPDGVPVVRGGNLTKGFVDDNFVFLTETKADELKASIARPLDIVFTHRGTLGQVGIIPIGARYPRYIVSQSQMLLSVDRKKLSPWAVYLFFCSPQGEAALLANTSTTGVPAISRPTTSLKAISLVIPPISISERFNELIQPLFLQREQLALESRTLATLRDTLLPKLLSGELSVVNFLL